MSYYPHHPPYRPSRDSIDPIGPIIFTASVFSLVATLLSPVYMFWLPLALGGLLSAGGVGGIYMSRTKLSRTWSWIGFWLSIVTILVGLYACYEYYTALAELRDLIGRR
jgi:hypothetical protein